MQRLAELWRYHAVTGVHFFRLVFFDTYAKFTKHHCGSRNAA